jgi:hypothetical protein
MQEFKEPDKVDGLCTADGLHPSVEGVKIL